jgi:NTP pyrophosphatase (non-canonical NTP hydrolase)
MGQIPEYGVTAICESPDSKELTLNEYQALALQTAIFSTDKNISYLTLALCGEVGEVADKVKKVIRDKHGQFYAPDMAAIALELGDAMWYIANIAKFLGYGLSDIGRLNLEKIQSRIERGTLHGSGDER